jgi:hypothetical protein
MSVTALVLATIGSTMATCAVTQNLQPLEIRFCPASQVRNFPLESSRDVQSLLLRNIAVINRGAAPAEVNGS